MREPGRRVVLRSFASLTVLLTPLLLMSCSREPGRQRGVPVAISLQERQKSGASRRPQRGRAEPRFALSLTVLQRRAAAQRGHPGWDQVMELGGLTSVWGIATDHSGEILLLGDADPNKSALELTSFVVALRNAYQVDREYEGDPGCSIDPREGAQDPYRIQEVKVFGMPHNCPMAARFVTLDYEMKRIAAGILTLEDHIPSLFELHRKAAHLCRGNPNQIEVIQSVHRLWFDPSQHPTPRYWQEEGVIWIRHPVQVELLTEKQFLDVTGRRTGSTVADPQAERFAAMMTELLASERIVAYAQLLNDYRLVEVARILRAQGVPAASLRYLLADFPLPRVPVPRFVGEIRREERGEVVCDVSVSERVDSGNLELWASQTIHRYQQMSRGGVNAGVAVGPACFARDSSQRLAEVRRRAFASRPSPGSMIWKVP